MKLSRLCTKWAHDLQLFSMLATSGKLWSRGEGAGKQLCQLPQF